MEDKGFKMNIKTALDETRADLWYVLTKQLKRMEEIQQAALRKNKKQARVQQSVADLLDNAKKKSEKAAAKGTKSAAKPASKSAVAKKLSEPATFTFKFTEKQLAANRPPVLRKRKNESGSEFLARKWASDDAWWKEKNRPAPKYRSVAKPYRKQNKEEGYELPKPKRRRKKKD